MYTPEVVRGLGVGESRQVLPEDHGLARPVPVGNFRQSRAVVDAERSPPARPRERGAVVPVPEESEVVAMIPGPQLESPRGIGRGVATQPVTGAHQIPDD